MKYDTNTTTQTPTHSHTHTNTPYTQNTHITKPRTSKCYTTFNAEKKHTFNLAKENDNNELQKKKEIPIHIPINKYKNRSNEVINRNC